MALETDFRPGDPLHSIKARWLGEVANALNTLDVEMDPTIDVPYVDKPPFPGKWVIRLPQGAQSGGAAKETPAAWMVRQGEDGWQIFSPFWVAGRATLKPDGMDEGWNDLGVTSGTLYAFVTWIGTKQGDTEIWSVGKPIITNTLNNVPADANPTDSTAGSRSVIVPIGTFVTPTDGTAPTFRQIHLGVIVEDAKSGGGGGGGLPDGVEAWGKVSIEEETDDSTSSGGAVTAYNIYQSKQVWNAAQQAFVEKENSKILMGVIPVRPSGIPDGTLLPGKVEYIVQGSATPEGGNDYGEVSSVRLVQHFLKWDEHSRSFVDAGAEADVVITELASHAQEHENQEGV